jgi:WD40 repeat protein/tRNA A-37 threonylcarbamoyl transferase component Bud32
MTRLHTCPNGHHWPAVTGQPSAPDDPDLICPVCGTMADTPAAVQPWPPPGKAAADNVPTTTPIVRQLEHAPTSIAALPTIPGFEILGELGRGGMGIVYKARQLDQDRLVAIKVIRKDRLLHADAVKRFRREAQAAARLAHPNVVRVFDSDHEGELHYLVMEFVDGVTLHRLAERDGPLSPADACEFMRQTALGLQHIHEQALVHRDIKPGNLMVAQPTTVGGNRPIRLVKILDMGVARLHQLGESPVETLTTLTQDGAVVGTADFIAPEQLEDPHGADIRADLYSLGCTFYATITGRVPFPGGTLIQKLDRQRWETPPAVSQLRPEIPPPVVAVIHKLMAKKPRERYQSPAELAAAIGQLSQAGFPAAVPRREAQRYEGHRDAVWCVAVAPDGERILSGGQDRACRLWSRQGGNLVRELQGFGQEVRGLGWLPGSNLVAVASGATVRLVDLDTGQELRRLTGHTDTIRAVAVSKDGSRLATGADDRTVRLWDTQNGRELLRCNGHTGSVTSVALAPDGEHLLSGSRDQTLKLWNLRNGKNLDRFAAPRGAVHAVGFSPDGRFAVSAHFDTVVRIWEVASGREWRRLTGHKQMATAAVFLPDGQRVVSGGQDQSVRLWDVDSGCELAAFGGHSGGVTSVAADPGGSWVVSGSLDRTVRMWEL